MSCRILALCFGFVLVILHCEPGLSACPDRNRDCGRFGPFAGPAAPCAREVIVARIGPPVEAFSADSRILRARCRSSVVEHSIGNGEVDSSILSGSTIPLFGAA